MHRLAPGGATGRHGGGGGIRGGGMRGVATIARGSHTDHRMPPRAGTADPPPPYGEDGADEERADEKCAGSSRRPALHATCKDAATPPMCPRRVLGNIPR